MGDSFLNLTPAERSEILAEFLTEGMGHLSTLNEKLLQAEKAVKKNIDMSDEDLNSMFRAAHTIKGAASFIGLTKTVSLTHEMETVLQKVRTRELALTEDMIDILFEGFDGLELLFKNLKDSENEEAEIDEIVAGIKQILEESGVAQTKDKKKKQKETRRKEKRKEGKEEEEEEVQSKYIEQFVIDADQNIEGFNTALIEHENEKGNAAHINELFRIVHTLKGSSGLVNAAQIQKIAHAMENILTLVREGKASLDDKGVSTLFKGIDAIREIVILLKDGKSIDINITTISGELNKYLKKITKDESLPVDDVDKNEEFLLREEVLQNCKESLSVDKLTNEGKDLIVKASVNNLHIYKVIVELEQFIPMRAMKAVIVEERFNKRGNIVYKNLDFTEISEENEKSVFIGIIYCTSLTKENIKKLLVLDGVSLFSIDSMEKSEIIDLEDAIQISASDAVTQKKKRGGSMKEASNTTGQSSVVTKPSIELSTIRIDTRRLDTLMNLSGELVIIRARFAQLVNSFNHETTRQKEVARALEAVEFYSESMNNELKGYFKKLQISDDTNAKKIIKIGEEIDIQIAHLNTQTARSTIYGMIHALDELTSSLGKVSSDIQSGVMQARMIPIEGVFNRFKRIVRDISKELGKTVNLEIEGEETELDKKIVDSLGDPLTHIIRNAVDHGIDDKDTRKMLGKPEVGTIRLKASHVGNHIWIEVHDDGKGIDVEKITQVAVQKELVAKEKIDPMSEREKLALIFLPGFSTAVEVTDLSGRGVGMDIVKNMITSVNGVVDIETEKNKATAIILKIPLTLAIIQALLVIVGDETYAFPLEGVLEIVSASPEDIYFLDGNATIKLRDHALSLIELEKVMKVRGGERDASISKKVVVVTDGEHKLGVVVDSLIGEEEIVIKALSDHFAGVKGIMGASILGDGTIALILDPLSLIQTAR
ncbi:MAG: chemotaxis protein CheA [Candidatus Omnitrophica bacterium]|nr:chemotaxis protein CheA [Candidatus Omnitrophota bacterium]